MAFVGAGGKSTAMFRLAEALAAGSGAGWRVVSTTTTHLGREQSALAPHHLILEDPGEQPAGLASALNSCSHVLVTGPLVEDGTRWGGVSPEWVEQVTVLPQVDAVLVEADGARCLPFKAPAEHEPVVPDSTTLLVPMVGVEAIGRVVRVAAHRPERVCALTGLSPEDAVTPQAVAAVLAHPAGGLKGRPAGARARALINQVETPEQLAAAREISASLLETPGRPFEAVVIGAVGTSSPVLEVRRPVAAVVLAAGRSLRMPGETSKLLFPWEDTTVIRRVVETLSGCPVRPLLVVTGYEADRVSQELAGAPAQMVHNPDYAAGEMLSSLQAGIRALTPEVSGCLVVLGDQPWLEPAVVEAVLEGYAAGPAGIVAPAFGGRRGHPVLIDRRHWPELLALEPGQAPRELLQRHPADVRLVDVESDSVLRDMDTWEEYQEAVGRGGSRPR